MLVQPDLQAGTVAVALVLESKCRTIITAMHTNARNLRYWRFVGVGPVAKIFWYDLEIRGAGPPCIKALLRFVSHESLLGRCRLFDGP